MGGTASVSAPQYPVSQQPGLTPMQPQQGQQQPQQQPLGGLSPQPFPQTMQQPSAQSLQPSQQGLIQSQPFQRPTTLPPMPSTPNTVYPASGQAQGQQMYTTGSVRQQFAHGGIPKIKSPRMHRLHTGPIHSNVAGRTDHLPVHVPNGSYVIPADIISAMGEGNTMAGFKQMRRMFSGTPYGGGKMPYGASGGPYGQPLPGKAEGGEIDDSVPVVVAGGEYVLTPDEVRFAGDGDMETGHRVLDEFVKRMRRETINTLKKLPGPKRD
jgi:hypothetical protein